MRPAAATAPIRSTRHQVNQSDHEAFRLRQPEKTTLYRIVQEHWLSFLQDRAREGRPIPRYIVREFEGFFQCGQLVHGFLRLKCDVCRHERLVPFSCRKRGFCPSCAGRRMADSAAFFVDMVLPAERIRQWVFSVPIPLRFWMARNSKLMGEVLSILIGVISRYYTFQSKKAGVLKSQTGSITLIQRYGGTINLNVHYHVLFIEGAYEDRDGKAVFHRAGAPTDDKVKAILETVQKRVIRLLKKRGFLEEKEEGVVHATDLFYGESGDESLQEDCQSASVKSRIATGERAGQRVRKIGSFGGIGDAPLRDGPLCYSVGGFSLHANVAARERGDIETLCRYVTRPPIAESRLSQRADGDIVYRFKKEWSDGTQAVLFSPNEFLEKIIAIIPPPRIHQTRFHGVLAPNHHLRLQVVPGGLADETKSHGERPPPEAETKTRSRAHRLSWSELLKRVFQVDITVCPDCGGQMNFIATIMEPKVIRAILEHLGLPIEPPRFAPARAPPQAALFDSDVWSSG